MLMLLAIVLSLAAAWLVDQLTVWRGLMPPGFLDPRRRALAMSSLALLLWVSVFAPLLMSHEPPDVDPATLEPGYAVLQQAILLVWLTAWYALGFVGVAGVTGNRAATLWWQQFDLSAPRISQELMIGVVVGVFAWLFVLVAAVAFGGLVAAFEGQEVSAREPPELIVWLAGLPIAWRLGISLAAGVVEELFYRGFLQKRIGVAFSTALFVGGHLAYGEPLMLFGVTLLSLIYARLVVWRRSILAAMVAHFLFDAIQLLIVIPIVLKGSGATPPSVAFLG